jgi:hypothetical protein
MTRRARLTIWSAVLAALVATPAHAASGVISTVAGTGAAAFGGDGVPAISTPLNLPRSVAAMPDGGFLIADRANHRVRRVLPDGLIATVAGNGTTGFSGDGAAATGAQLDFLHAAVPTPDGGFLISDTRNQRIRYVSPGGMITTVAGSGPFGCFCSGGFSGDTGTATSARLNNPHGIAADPNGGFLIADTDNNRVRRVDSGGTIMTVAGSGPAGSGNGSFSGDGGQATAARLDRPFDVAPIPDGGFLIADTGNQVIRRVDGDGTITTVAGRPDEQGFSGDEGPATSGRLSGPHGVNPMPDGGFLIADKNNQRVRRVAPDGTIATVAGSGPTGDANGAYGGDGGPATEALLNRPKSVAATADGFLVADESNNRIRFTDLSVEPSGGSPPVSAGPPAVVPLSLMLKVRRLQTYRRGGVKLRFISSAEALIRLEVRRRGRALVSRRLEAGPGVNVIALERRQTRGLEPGRYKLLLSASAADGQRDLARASLRVRRSP